MTTRQNIELRRSEVRQRLGEIANLAGEARTEEVASEHMALMTELRESEPRLQAAIASEEQDVRLRGGPRDGETVERDRLLGETRMSDYLGAAAMGGGLTGRAAELNAAFEVPLIGGGGGAAVPWQMLEERAFTTTDAHDGPVVQRPILQRLFGPGVLDALGVRLDSVPVGRSEWPLITGGVSPAQAVEGTAAAAAVTAAFSIASLKPKRLSGTYEYSHEIAASVPDLETSIRRDLADAVHSKMSALIVSGAAVDPNTANTAANVPGNGGFTVALTQSDDTAVADAARYGRLHAQGVDAIHASSENEVMSVVGDETYQHAAGVYIAGSGKSGSQLLMERSAGCMASTYIPDTVSTIQLAILHAAGPNGGGMMRGDSVAAVWPTLEIIRDMYTKASQGVVLTWVTLWDAHVALRPSAYKLVGIKLA